MGPEINSGGKIREFYLNTNKFYSYICAHMSNIKNLIFDLGGVIINIDPALSVQAFKDAGVNDIDAVYAALQGTGHLYKIESGELTVDELYNAFISLSSCHIEKGTFIDCWNELLLDIPKERLQLLQHLKNNYKIYLLSNTNPIHMDEIYAYVKKEHALDLNELFDKVYLSYEHYLCKPDVRIFQKIIQENNLSYEQTLFFDDTQMHLQAAATLGIKTALVTPDKPVTAVAQEWDL